MPLGNFVGGGGRFSSELSLRRYHIEVCWDEVSDDEFWHESALDKVTFICHLYTETGDLHSSESFATEDEAEAYGQEWCAAESED